MKRRSETILVSSDDDDEFCIPRNCSSATSRNLKSQARRSSAKNKNKKPQLSHSLSSSSQLLSNFDQSKFLSGSLAEDFSGFKLSTDFRFFDATESWVDKYRPQRQEDLAVHKKKVEEVKLWFQEKMTTSKQASQNNVLIITGQAGIGKSATVRVLASHFEVEVFEWNTPVPTIWQEHVHNSNSGMRYVSKLDEFENFVDRVRKYGTLSSSFRGTKQAIVLLIEDLPVANGRVAQGRLINCLQNLVKSVQIPTVILITEYSAADTVDVGMRRLEELSSSLEDAGAHKIGFNPITVNSIKKVLSRICKEEKCETSNEQVDLIANVSGGDIRHAIMTLQYVCLRQQEKKLIVSSELEAGSSLAVGRDQSLSLFHALGKFLHNKRDTESISRSQDGFCLKDGFSRLPLKMDAPEKVLCQAYGQARPVAEFLHENVLEFLSKEGIEDAAIVTSYLSDADCLLSSSVGPRNYEAENVIQSAAASVAVRGVLFGNVHPSPSRWHSIRRPQLWQVEKSARRNMQEIERQKLEKSLCNVSVICTDYRPTLKWLGYREHADHTLTLQNHASHNVSDDDDDIEEC